MLNSVLLIKRILSFIPVHAPSVGPFLLFSFKQGVRDFIRYINEYILVVKWVVISQIDFCHKACPPFLNFGGE
jgi:hypothetical protein